MTRRLVLYIFSIQIDCYRQRPFVYIPIYIYPGGLLARKSSLIKIASIDGRGYHNTISIHENIKYRIELK